MTGTGIVVAMRWEARGLDRCSAAIRISGPGARRASDAARRLVDGGASALVSWGVAAGIDPSLRAGTLLLPDRVLAANGDRFRPDVGWHGRAVHAVSYLEPMIAPLAEAAFVLHDPASKAELRRRTSAVAADMESVAVLRVAAAAGLPALVIRAVLDPASLAVPEAWSRAVSVDGRLRAMRVLGALARPRSWGVGLQLAQCRHVAARTLRGAASILNDA